MKNTGIRDNLNIPDSALIDDKMAQERCWTRAAHAYRRGWKPFQREKGQSGKTVFPVTRKADES